MWTWPHRSLSLTHTHQLHLWFCASQRFRSKTNNQIVLSGLKLQTKLIFIPTEQCLMKEPRVHRHCPIWICESREESVRLQAHLIKPISTQPYSHTCCKGRSSATFNTIHAVQYVWKNAIQNKLACHCSIFVCQDYFDTTLYVCPQPM
jgi:hypothetical protein